MQKSATFDEPTHIAAGLSDLSTPAAAKPARGGGAEWLREMRPITIVGHAYYVFELPDRAPAR